MTLSQYLSFCKYEMNYFFALGIAGAREARCFAAIKMQNIGALLRGTPNSPTCRTAGDALKNIKSMEITFLF